MELLVIGGSGFLGRAVTRQALLAGHRVTATCHTSVPPANGADWRVVDIRRRDDVTSLAVGVRPEVIVNAAYVQSDWETTADGGTNVAVAAAAAGARLVHVSSDAVFSGAAPSYDETCPPDPTTRYGAAKAAAETAVKGISPNAVIARTSLIIGDGDSKHEQLVHALAAGAAGVLFTDEVRCPVHVTDLARALLEFAAGTQSGVRHVAGADAVSRYELGLLVASRDGLDPAALPAGPRTAGPSDVRLDCTRTQAGLATRLRGARDFLAPAVLCGDSPADSDRGVEGAQGARSEGAEDDKGRLGHVGVTGRNRGSRGPRRGRHGGPGLSTRSCCTSRRCWPAGACRALRSFRVRARSTYATKSSGDPSARRAPPRSGDRGARWWNTKPFGGMGLVLSRGRGGRGGRPRRAGRRGRRRCR